MSCRTNPKTFYQKIIDAYVNKVKAESRDTVEYLAMENAGVVVNPVADETVVVTIDSEHTNEPTTIAPNTPTSLAGYLDNISPLSVNEETRSLSPEYIKEVLMLLRNSPTPNVASPEFSQFFSPIGEGSVSSEELARLISGIDITDDKADTRDFWEEYILNIVQSSAVSSSGYESPRNTASTGNEEEHATSIENIQAAFNNEAKFTPETQDKKQVGKEN
jgi:hypothetical protein